MSGHFAFYAVFLLFAATQALQLYGKFNKDVIPMKMAFDVDTMLVEVSSPVNSHPSFRPTSNLHVFSLKLVAMKSDEKRQCYIQRFHEAESELKGRAMNALSTNGELGNIMEETISVEGLIPLHRTHYTLLGENITHFCGDYTVFVLQDVQKYPHIPHGVQRRKRAAASFDVLKVCPY